jgi:cytochrome c biogenesis protein
MTGSRWRRVVARVASRALTVVGFALLGVAVAAAYLTDALPPAAVVAPLVLLATNLAAALVTFPALRRGGLGLFHVALLACLLIVAWGRLTHYEGRVEIVQGGVFDAASADASSRGPLHDLRLADVRFEQGTFSVDYAPRLKRSHTRSEIRVHEADGARAETVGDQRALQVNGYRFYTTHNKGFAPLLTWTAPGAAPLTGAVHLPSYPLHDWQQQQDWTPPGGPRVRLWLRVPHVADELAAWRLQPDRVDARLVVEIDGRRHELAAGESARGAYGELRYERLLGWMGYRITYDPSLAPLFWAACVGVAGLVLHLWPPSPNLRRVQARRVPA